MKTIKKETIEQTIGRNLKYFRYQAGMSQEKFYEMCNLSPKYLASVERGEVNVTVSFLDNIAKVLKVDIVEFFNTDTSRVITKRRIDAKEKN